MSSFHPSSLSNGEKRRQQLELGGSSSKNSLPKPMASAICAPLQLRRVEIPIFAMIFLGETQASGTQAVPIFSDEGRYKLQVAAIFTVDNVFFLVEKKQQTRCISYNFCTTFVQVKLMIQDLENQPERISNLQFFGGFFGFPKLPWSAHATHIVTNRYHSVRFYHFICVYIVCIQEAMEMLFHFFMFLFLH